MKVEEEIMNELLHVWKKPDLDKITRAKFIRHWLKENHISLREACKMFNIPKSTLTGWLVWDKITPKQMKIMIDNNIPIRTIHESLRNTTDRGEEVVNNILERGQENELTLAVDRAEHLLKPFVHRHVEQHNGLMMRLSQLKDLVNRIIMNLEK